MKREREYGKLDKGAMTVAWLTVIVVIILAVAAVMSANLADKLGGSAYAALIPYVGYIAVVSMIGVALYQIMLHLVRMEIIALDGQEAFEPAEEPVE